HPFIAALVASLALRELGNDAPPATPFASAGQVLRLFAGLDAEEAAINLVNGHIISAQPPADAEALAHAFARGDLLFLPRDAARLHTQETRNALPGALAFLLARKQAQHKAFTAYLRSGTPPLMARKTLAHIARARPVLPSFPRELAQDGTV
ncbi:MAG: hypothetical protein K2Q01_03685, partial [Rickettsiales bacterium]|nr:hypothetical protein [Rickettsiales bacterium]